MQKYRLLFTARGTLHCSYERVKFYISGANVPGEGELKCIDWLKRMSKGGSENAVIVGGDADLILQGLALTEVSAPNKASWVVRWVWVVAVWGC